MRGNKMTGDNNGNISISTDPKMTPNEIATFHHEHFMQTRDIQWKINISVWTLLAAGILLGVNKTPQFEWPLAIAAGLFITIFHGVAVVQQQKSLDYDKCRWKNYLPTEQDSKTNSFLWNCLQISVTISLALLMFAALTGEFRSNSTNTFVYVDGKPVCVSLDKKYLLQIELVEESP